MVPEFLCRRLSIQTQVLVFDQQDLLYSPGSHPVRLTRLTSFFWWKLGDLTYRPSYHSHLPDELRETESILLRIDQRERSVVAQQSDMCPIVHDQA